MSQQAQVTELPLSDVALRLSKAYNVALNMLLRGDLVGRKNERGRWMVTLESVERYEKQSAA